MISIFSAEISILAIIVATALNVGLGMLWYGPFFKKTWLRLVGMTSEEALAKSEPITYVYTVLTALLRAFGLSIIIYYANIAWQSNILESLFQENLSPAISPYLIAILVAVISWATISFPTDLNNALFGKKRKQLVLLDSGYHLVGLIVMALVVTVAIAK